MAERKNSHGNLHNQSSAMSAGSAAGEAKLLSRQPTQPRESFGAGAKGTDGHSTKTGHGAGEAKGGPSHSKDVDSKGELTSAVCGY